MLQADILHRRAAEDVDAITRNIEISPTNPVHLTPTIAMERAPSTEKMVDGGTMCRPSFSRVNSDTIGYLWTGELDLNTLRVDGEIF